MKPILYFISGILFSIVILSTGCEKAATEVEPGNLNGYWSRGDIVIYFEGDIGVFDEVNSGNWYEAAQNGLISQYDSKFISVTRVSKNTFYARELWSKRIDGVVVEVAYGEVGDLTLSEDGTTLNVITPNPWYENSFNNDTYQKVNP